MRKSVRSIPPLDVALWRHAVPYESTTAVFFFFTNNCSLQKLRSLHKHAEHCCPWFFLNIQTSPKGCRLLSLGCNQFNSAQICWISLPYTFFFFLVPFWAVWCADNFLGIQPDYMKAQKYLLTSKHDDLSDHQENFELPVKTWKDNLRIIRQL